MCKNDKKPQIQIVGYRERYTDGVKDLLVELQEHLASLDERGVVVLKECYRDGYFDYIIREIMGHCGKIFVAVYGDKTVGVVVCKIYQAGEGEEANLTTTSPKVGFISDLVVTKSERGRGIGKLLIARAEEYFAWHECKYVRLDVAAPNVNAVEFYKKLGFEVNCLYLSKKCGGEIETKPDDRQEQVDEILRILTDEYGDRAAEKDDLRDLANDLARIVCDCAFRLNNAMSLVNCFEEEMRRENEIEIEIGRAWAVFTEMIGLLECNERNARRLYESFREFCDPTVFRALMGAYDKWLTKEEKSEVLQVGKENFDRIVWEQYI